ncbi:hypothetical protein GQR58_025525 [Nymphon striatum]|nr:hypothetical protein GQR58_025525 [Nymphon striatum]
MLFVGKVLRRFLDDENGPTESLEMKCLKPKVGSGTTLEDTPTQLPDISLVSLAVVIAGPLEVLPLKGSTKFNIPNYEDIVEHYKVAVKLDRSSLLDVRQYIFPLKDLYTMYESRRRDLGVDSGVDSEVNKTGLKDKLISHFHNQCQEQSSGTKKYETDALTMVQVAKQIRKDLFDKPSQTFDGSFAADCQYDRKGSFRDGTGISICQALTEENQGESPGIINFTEAADLSQSTRAFCFTGVTSATCEERTLPIELAIQHHWCNEFAIYNLPLSTREMANRPMKWRKKQIFLPEKSYKNHSFAKKRRADHGCNLEELQMPPPVCILHVSGMQHGEFIPLHNIRGPPQEKLEMLHNLREKRLLQSRDSPARMEAVCRLIPDNLDDVDLERTGYHRGCYQAFTKHQNRLKCFVPDDEPSTIRSPRKSSTSSKNIFPPECIFCEKLETKVSGRTERCVQFASFKGKEAAWTHIKSQALEIGDNRLHRKVTGEDLFVREARFLS